MAQEPLYDYRFTIGPGTTNGAWLDVLGCVDGGSDSYIRSARQITTPWQFTCLVRRLRKAGLGVCDMRRRPYESVDTSEPVEVDGPDENHEPEGDPTA